MKILCKLNGKEVLKEVYKVQVSIFGTPSILIYNVNNEFINEYELILNYIKSKGFIVVDISKLISE